ncbi:ABC transporter permease [Nocardioides sp. W7]|uniref:ABC transporter permease n=1 Tax=Nocardioides sp. W7 TaxID=2931390 RepID=UPI001FD474C2|nr:ABC transporter permease [Nocardioides sp. W7]
MTRYALRRLAVALPILVAVTFCVFVLVDLAPGDPAAAIAGENPTAERIAQIRASLGLDDPLLTRYWGWLVDAVQADLGASLTNGQAVTEAIGDRLPTTLSLVVVAMTITLVVGLAAGLVAALQHGRAADRLITACASAAIALPPFWVALVLVMLFSVQARWLPAIGYEPLSAGIWPWLSHLLLPAIALSLLPMAEVAMQFRQAMTTVLKLDYITNAESRGLSRPRVLGKHAAKNAAVPVTTVFAYRFAQVLGGTVAIESVFDLPGIGRLAVTSVLSRDIPVLLGLVAFTTLIVLLINLVVDISYGYFNPKVRV